MPDPAQVIFYVNFIRQRSIAKVYLSLFPSKEAATWLEGIQSNAFQVKHDLAQILKNELRRIPELLFFMDDSLDYIEGIDAALQSPDNPIIERDKLDKRKKEINGASPFFYCIALLFY